MRATTAQFSNRLLARIGIERIRPGQVVCLVLAHNEGPVLADCLRYYRSFGPLAFLVVDDHSDDGTFEMLMDQPDVTVFRPVAGSSYARHKREWRGALLDHYADGKWAVVPDADERLAWRDIETRPFTGLVADLEAEGAEAFYCTMVDMYKDGPLAAQVYTGKGPLAAEFTLFDDPARDPLSHRYFAGPRRFVRKWQTPRMIMFGGMRDRMFFGSHQRQGPLARAVLKALPTIRNVEPTGLDWLFEQGVRLALKPPKTGMPEINLTKIPLIKWKAGSWFYGGAHAVSSRYKLSRETGVLLHYPITKGEAGVRYAADRRQHAADGAYYRALLEGGANKTANIRYFGTSEFRTSRDLGAFMREAGAHSRKVGTTLPPGICAKTKT